MYMLYMTNNGPTFSKNLLIPKHIKLNFFIHLGTIFLQTTLKIQCYLPSVGNCSQNLKDSMNNSTEQVNAAS